MNEDDFYEMCEKVLKYGKEPFRPEPWQAALMRSVMDGEEVTIVGGRRSGKQAAQELYDRTVIERQKAEEARAVDEAEKQRLMRELEEQNEQYIRDIEAKQAARELAESEAMAQ